MSADLPIDPDLERAYSPSSMVGGSAAPFVDDYVRRSALASTELGDRVQTLSGGTLLVVPANRTAPTLVFVHGGYWQALSAADSLYLAPQMVRHGWGFAAVEYPLAPQATIEQMIELTSHGLSQVAAAVTGPLVVAGHSAGAQLLAMADLPSTVTQVVLISGVHDLRDLLRTSMNRALGLDAHRAHSLSPIVQPVRLSADIDIAVWWGAQDTPRFREMSAEYGELLRANGRKVTTRAFADTHHFDIVDRLADLPAATAQP